MKIENAIKKLSKLTKVEKGDNNQYYAILNGTVISFYKNGGGSDQAICFHTKRVGEQSDSMTDYFPGSFHNNLTQAINSATRNY